MAFINKQDTNGTKGTLLEGEFGYDKYTTGGDRGRVYVGTDSGNVALAKKDEIPSLTGHVATNSAQALGSAGDVLTLSSNTLTLARGDGSTDTVDLSAFLDEDSRAIASGTLNGPTGIVTFTRDDATTFTLDLSDLLDDTNLVTSVGGYAGVVTATQLLTAIKTVDGTGSGLDADTLDGHDTAYFYPASNPNSYTSNSGTVTSVATTGAITGGTITGAGTIAHSNASGYKHVPSGGANGQWLKYSADGTASWDYLYNDTTVVEW